jgi:hypothetical protein
LDDERITAMARSPLSNVALTCLILTVATGLTSGLALLPPQPATAAQVADLQEQLEFGLKTRRPAEIAFIARVVTLVEQDRLPLALVKSTFQWARPKQPRPFPYFERAMRIRAARIGVQI